MTNTVQSRRPFASALERLRAVGLRPTRQRLALCRALFDQGDRHVTAESLHEESQSAGLRISLATVYNTLHQFTDAGLLREVAVDGDKTYFDTNVSQHHHFYREDEGRLTDIDGSQVRIEGLPQPPDGQEVDRIDIVVRLRRSDS